ncbi:helix-turn-helix transcriptional regulator [Paenibacillus sp. FSL R7-0345]|uniref:helix-turn-helix domain-containing protein n=1 Tax=Paenibacillus sp. FSL R7-0345 TaxID=2954535 RepID=UPI00315A2BE9
MSEQREAHMGEKIRRLRKQLGWTQEELAYRAGIDTSYLGQIERGKRRSPTLGMIGKIADSLSVDSSLLLEQPEAEAADKGGIPWSDIPERVALELRQRSPNEQLMFYRILQIIQQFLK